MKTALLLLLSLSPLASAFLHVPPTPHLTSPFSTTTTTRNAVRVGRTDVSAAATRNKPSRRQLLALPPVPRRRRPFDTPSDVHTHAHTRMLRLQQSMSALTYPLTSLTHTLTEHTHTAVHTLATHTLFSAHALYTRLLRASARAYAHAHAHLTHRVNSVGRTLALSAMFVHWFVVSLSAVAFCVLVYPVFGVPVEVARGLWSRLRLGVGKSVES